MIMILQTNRKNYIPSHIEQRILRTGNTGFILFH